MKKVENKKELEAELLKVRSEIQWRERELEEFHKTADHLYAGAAISIAYLLLLGWLFGEEAMGLAIIVWIIASIVIITIIGKGFDKTKEGKKIKKTKLELRTLKKRKTELEKRLDNLESKK